MRRRTIILGGLGGIVLAGAAGGAAWIASRPSPRPSVPQPPIAPAEVDQVLAALKPPKRARPLIAIIGINDATETTDYVIPYGILRRADVADVVTVATGPGVVKLYPALSVEAETTVAAFDRDHPDGADYVIVPAMSRDDDPVVMRWLKEQSTKGATIVGVCAGAKVVAEAGLLDGKRATTHWYFVDDLRERHPSVQYVPNRRVVVDRGVATTTGISASMPMSLTLIEAIAGRAKAQAVAQDLGLPEWDIRHQTDAFRLTRPFATAVLQNVVEFWNREQFGIPLASGIDEVSLALVADAWSRTYRSSAKTFAATVAPLVSRNGMRIVPDRAADNWPADRIVASFTDLAPARALDDALGNIARRYGDRTASVVAMQLEYPAGTTEWARAWSTPVFRGVLSGR